MVEKRKTTSKKQRKAQWAWLEQVFLRIDAMEKRIDSLEQTVKFISDEIQKLQDSDKNG
jgi:cell division protein FtsB